MNAQAVVALAAEGGNQRGVNIDDPVFKGTDDLTAEEAAQICNYVDTDEFLRLAKQYDKRVENRIGRLSCKLVIV